MNKNIDYFANYPNFAIFKTNSKYVVKQTWIFYSNKMTIKNRLYVNQI